MDEDFEGIRYGISKTRVRVPVEMHGFHINISCFQLEDALASGSKSPNLGEHC